MREEDAGNQFQRFYERPQTCRAPVKSYQSHRSQCSLTSGKLVLTSAWHDLVRCRKKGEKEKVWKMEIHGLGLVYHVYDLYSSLVVGIFRVPVAF